MALLESAAVDVYGNRLKRRRQRKRVVGELGLLNRTRVASRPSQYHRLFSNNKGWVDPSTGFNLIRKAMLKIFFMMDEDPYQTIANVLNPATQSYERLFKFSRLVCSMDFDYMMEGFQYESELKHKVIKMQVRRYQ